MGVATLDFASEWATLESLVQDEFGDVYCIILMVWSLFLFQKEGCFSP